MRHRPIGIGIQGLADLFILMRLPFESEKSQELNLQLFETMYYGALEAVSYTHLDVYKRQVLYSVIFFKVSLYLPAFMVPSRGR